MTSSPPLEGVIVPVVAPVDDQDRLDDLAFRQVLRYLLAAGVDALFIGGTAGMGPLLADREWRRMMEIAHDEVGAECPLLAGIMAPSTARALDLVRAVEAIGYDYLVVTPTYYVTPTRDHEFLRYYGALREATDREIVAYNIPGCTGSSLPVPVILEMARRGWTRSCKESSADRDYFRALLDGAADVGLSVYQGSEINLVWGLRQGARGAVPVSANYCPELFVRLWRAACDGDQTTLENLHVAIAELVATVINGDHLWLAGIMYATHLRGFGQGFPVRPLRGLPEASAQAIQALMDRLSASLPTR